MNEKNYNRLTGIFLEMNPELADLGVIAFEDTGKKLKSLTLSVVCGSRLSSSYAHQACLLTVVNCGKRSFQGGIYVQLENDCKCLIPGFSDRNLSETILELGGQVGCNLSTKTLFIGNPATDLRGIHLVFREWAGGFSTKPNPKLDSNVFFPLGAIAAASIAISSVFLSALRIDVLADSKSQGISFWNPQQHDWQIPDPEEPVPQYFPKRLWLLGLGHLGQAYAWAIGMLPFSEEQKPSVLLQDYDTVDVGNYEAGMLSEKSFENFKKTRVVASFLEQRKITTTILERKYTASLERLEDEPEIMLSGLDNGRARRAIRLSDFKSVFDFGLGGNLGTFDLVRFHNLPYAGNPEELWLESNDVGLKMDVLEKLTAKLNDCGYVKGIAVSFVGVFTSCFAISELLRAYHNGRRVIKANISLRQLSQRKCVIGDNYAFELFIGQVKFSCE